MGINVEQEVAEIKKRIARLAEEGSDYVDENMPELQEQLESAKKSAVKAGKDATAYAKENPWRVAGIAAAAGFLAAALLGNKRKK